MNKLVVLLVAVFCSISVQAQELSQNALVTKPVDEKCKQLAEKLLIATKVDENITRTMAAIKKSQMAALSKQFTGAQLQNAGEISEAVGAIMEKELCWDKLKEPLVNTYAEAFSAEELEALIKFYESPIGRKIVEKQPELQRKSIMMMQRIFMQIAPKITNITKELIEKQKASVIAAQKAIGTTVPIKPVDSTVKTPDINTPATAK